MAPLITNEKRFAFSTRPTANSIAYSGRTRLAKTRRNVNHTREKVQINENNSSPKFIWAFNYVKCHPVARAPLVPLRLGHKHGCYTLKEIYQPDWVHRLPPTQLDTASLLIGRSTVLGHLGKCMKSPTRIGISQTLSLKWNDFQPVSHFGTYKLALPDCLIMIIYR